MLHFMHVSKMVDDPNKSSMIDGLINELVQLSKCLIESFEEHVKDILEDSTDEVLKMMLNFITLQRKYGILQHALRTSDSITVESLHCYFLPMWQLLS